MYMEIFYLFIYFNTMPAVVTANQSGKMTSFDKVILIRLRGKNDRLCFIEFFKRINGTCNHYVKGIVSSDVFIFYVS